MSEDSRTIEYTFSEKAMTIREALDKPKSGFRIGSAERFIDIQAPLYTKGEYNFVRNRVYSFACNFRGHEANSLNEHHDYVDPLEIPLNDVLDFFDAGKKIWGQSEAELSGLKFYNRIKKRRLISLQNSVNEDMERVAEAIVLAVADKAAETDPKLAKVVGRLEESIDYERGAEEANHDAVTAYAQSTFNSPTSSTAAIIGIDRAERIERKAERKRVELTKDVMEAVTNQLNDLNLFEAVNDWVFISNRN